MRGLSVYRVCDWFKHLTTIEAHHEPVTHVQSLSPFIFVAVAALPSPTDQLLQKSHYYRLKAPIWSTDSKKIIAKKMFDAVTRTVLQHYTTNPPSTEDSWYGLWNTIPITLFPSSQRYIVAPQRHIPGENEPDFVNEVVKLMTPMQFRFVLIVKARNIPHWKTGISLLERQIKSQMHAAFS
jgi:hypothetical protein